MNTKASDYENQQSPSNNGASSVREDRRSSKRFKFKARVSKARTGDNARHSLDSSSHPYHRHYSHHHHRSKRHRLSPSPALDSPAPQDSTAAGLHPDIAFRESLFDAMGDDEGASYWESVYGQPIHTYPDEKRNEETGELEKMTDEEYIAFVRRGMWERSWEGIQAQREERRKERKREERAQKAETPRGNRVGAGVFEREVEESLRRGVQRQERKSWQEKWRAYEEGWDDLRRLAISINDSTDEKAEADLVCLRNVIIWPVESGKSKDVNPEEILKFMIKTAKSSLTLQGGNRGNESLQLQMNLKRERVRWHPDKVQQLYGSLSIDEGTLKGVTEVFQVMDRLYSERK